MNRIEGIIDSDNARKTLGFLKQIAHIKQYKVTKIESTIRYSISPLLK